MADVNTRKRRSRRHITKRAKSPNGELKPFFRSEAHKKMKHFNSDPNMMKDPHLFRALQADYGSLQRKYSAMNAQNKEYEKHIQQSQHENQVLKQEILHLKETVDDSYRVKRMLSAKSISVPDFSDNCSEQIDDLQKTNRKYKELIKRLKSKRTAMREENQRLQVELDRVNTKYDVITAENAQQIQENNRLQSKNMEIEQENERLQQVHDDHIGARDEETRLLREQIQSLRDELSALKQKEIFASVVNDIKKSNVVQNPDENIPNLEKRLMRFQEENASLMEQLNVLQHNKVEYERNIPQDAQSEKNDVISEFSDDDLDEMQALFKKHEGPQISNGLKENVKTHPLGWCLWSQYFNFYVH